MRSLSSPLIYIIFLLKKVLMNLLNSFKIKMNISHWRKMIFNNRVIFCMHCHPLHALPLLIIMKIGLDRGPNHLWRQVVNPYHMGRLAQTWGSISTHHEDTVNRLFVLVFVSNICCVDRGFTDLVRIHSQ